MIESLFLFFPLFFAYCCAFSINYPRRQQRNFLYLHKQYYSCSLISHMYSYFVIEIILMSFFFFSLSLSLSLSFFLVFGTISLIYVFLSRFFFSLSFLLYYSCFVRVGANLTYACRDRYAHTYTYTQLKLHLVRV